MCFIFAGLVYAVGGHNGSKHLGSGEVFDPVTAKWKKISSMVTQKTGVYDVSNYLNMKTKLQISLKLKVHCNIF